MNGSFCNLCALGLGWRYIFSLHCADELQQERNSCPQLRSCFIGSRHVGVSKRFSRSISLAVYCLYTHFLADQISCRSYVGSVYRMRSLAVYHSNNKLFSVKMASRPINTQKSSHLDRKKLGQCPRPGARFSKLPIPGPLCCFVLHSRWEFQKF